jgi:hypothetical protein
MAATFQYNLNDYNAILFGNNEKFGNNEGSFTYKLPSNVITIINFLAKKFGPSEIHEKPKKTYTNNSNSNSNKSNESSWINTQSFKPTTIIDKTKPEGGTDKIMNDIRSSLNKMSNKNYDTNRDVIIRLLNELVKNQPIINVDTNIDTNPDTNANANANANANNIKSNANADLIKIGNNIFDIASTNKFFSEIYAKLYKDISKEFPEIFNSILSIFLEGFTNTMKTICYVDQKDNYDDFCKYNKDNDKRKATSMFITNLVKNDVIDIDVLKNIIVTIQMILDTYMNEENRVNEVEEIIENIYILLTNNLTFLKACEDTEIMECIIRLSKSKPKELPSMSSRAIFKCLDIVDKSNR